MSRSGTSSFFMHIVIPERKNSIPQVQLVIENEENIIQDVIAKKQTWWNMAKRQYPFLQSSSFLEYPETMEAFQKIVNIIDQTTSSDLSAIEISKVCNRYSIPRSALEEILVHFRRTVNWTEMNALQDQMRNISAKSAKQPNSIEKCLLDLGIATDDSLKHKYVRNDDGAENLYTFPKVRARLLAILGIQEILSIDAETDHISDNLSKEVYHAEVNVCNSEFGFVFDRTNFTTEGGNRYHDTGYIVFDNGYTFKVKSVRKIQNLVIHYAEYCQNDSSYV